MSTLPIETSESNESLPLKAEALLARRAQQRPSVTALADPANLAALDLGQPRSFTYHEADVAVDALAAFLVELGLKPGDTIAVQLPNVAVAPLTLLAAWRAGLTVAALPMLWRAHEIGRACEEIAPKALIGVSPARIMRADCAGSPQSSFRCASCSLTAPNCPTAWPRSTW
jgi:non-ribosomal peptide synthetase component E (peptide arylation enzyme)